MTALAPVADKLGKLIPRLASDHDGEVVATVRAIGRTLHGVGADWHDLAGALGGAEFCNRLQDRGELTDLVVKLLKAIHQLSRWERGYVLDVSEIIRRGGAVSPRQSEKLAEIYEQRVGPHT